MVSPDQEQKNSWNLGKMKKYLSNSKVEVHINNKRVCLNLCPLKLRRLLPLVFNAALNLFIKPTLTIISIYLRKSDSKPSCR